LHADATIAVIVGRRRSQDPCFLRRQFTQNGARLNCDVLNIYFYAPGEGPNAQPAGAKAAKAPAAAGSDDATTGNIKQLVAEGHVFYVTQSESARGEHGVYDAEPDTITMTGAVVVVQGNNVMRGDRMLIDRKSGQTTMISTATGRNNPNRVRGVFYNEGESAPTGQAAPAQKGQNAVKAPAAPAKKP